MTKKIKSKSSVRVDTRTDKKGDTTMTISFNLPSLKKTIKAKNLKEVKSKLKTKSI